MDDLVEKVAAAIESYLDYETGTDDSKNSAARAAVIATLEALADEYDAETVIEYEENPKTGEEYAVSWELHLIRAHSANGGIAKSLRERAQSLVK